MTNNLKPIGLVVDEGADLPREITERNLIDTVSFKADWPEVENLPGENIYQKIREAEKRGIKSFAKTSQPSPKDFLTAFRKKLNEFEIILCITATSKHSGTYNSAIQAKTFLDTEEKNRVWVFDSLNVTGGEGLLVLKAIELIEKGKEKMEEIIKELEIFRSKINFRVIFKDPKWVEASGRIPHLLADLIRRLGGAGIRPLLGLKEGKIKLVGVKKGAKDIRNALFKEIEEKTRKLRNQGKRIKAVITHADNLNEAQELKEMIEKNLEGIEIVFLNLINNIVGTLAGPDAMALAWVETE